MLNLTVANCPVSWGIEDADDPRNVPWEVVLDEIAAAGYTSVELGPPGYLPSDPATLREALVTRGLDLSAGYCLGHFADQDFGSADTAMVRRVCNLLASLGARTLVVMEAMDPERNSTVGRSADARRLAAASWQRLIHATHTIAEIASEEFGLSAAFHPHVATHVEFDDEIDHFGTRSRSHRTLPGYRA